MRKMLVFMWLFSVSTYAQEPAANVLFASVVDKDITPPIGVPLAGYGGGERRLVPWDFWNKHEYAHYLAPSKGVLDPIRAKVMLLRSGNQKLVFISLDVIGIAVDIYEALLPELKPLGVRRENLFMSATHTHSGPGAVTSNGFWQIVAVDRLEQKIFNRLIKDLTAVVREAFEKAEPAELFSTSFETNRIQRNRREKTRPVDQTANLLFAKSLAGRWLGAIANVAIHGTALDTSNHLYSADVLGRIEHALEKRIDALNGDGGAKVLFVNGAEGDVRPQHSGAERMDPLAENFADQAMTAFGSLRKVTPDWDVYWTDVELGAPKLNLHNCTEGNMQKLFGKNAGVALGAWLPTKVRLWHIKLGHMRMMTWPGEATSSLGLRLKQMASEAGAEQTWNFGLTNHHLAYFTSPAEFKEGGYEACNSLYGPQGGEKLLKGHKKLLTQ